MSNIKIPDFFSTQVSEAKRFFLDLNPSQHEFISVISGGCEHCAADYEINRNNFPYFSVEFVSHGIGFASLSDMDYQLTSGTLFSYGPGIRHHIKTYKNKPLVKYFVDFVGTNAAKLLKNASLSPGSIIQTSAIGNVTSIFDDIINNGNNNSPLSKQICSTLLEYLLLKITETKIPFGHVNSQAYETYRRCRKYIEDHAFESKTLDMIADECNIDVAYLCRLFKRFDHKSPYQYIIKIKMAYAAKNLQESNTSIKQLAYDLNFSDAFHFSRVFKSFYGVPPREFIKLRQ